MPDTDHYLPGAYDYAEVVLPGGRHALLRTRPPADLDTTLDDLTSHTQDPLADVVAAIHYRPDWRFTTDRDRVVVSATVPDVAGGRPTRLGASFLTSPDWTVRRILHRVWAMIREIEDHERLEWLTYRGDRPFPPHDPDGKLRTTP